MANFYNKYKHLFEDNGENFAKPSYDYNKFTTERPFNLTNDQQQLLNDQQQQYSGYHLQQQQQNFYQDPLYDPTFRKLLKQNDMKQDRAIYQNKPVEMQQQQQQQFYQNGDYENTPQTQQQQQRYSKRKKYLEMVGQNIINTNMNSNEQSYQQQQMKPDYNQRQNAIMQQQNNKTDNTIIDYQTYINSAPAYTKQVQNQYFRDEKDKFTNIKEQINQKYNEQSFQNNNNQQQPYYGFNKYNNDTRQRNTQSREERGRIFYQQEPTKQRANSSSPENHHLEHYHQCLGDLDQLKKRQAGYKYVKDVALNDHSYKSVLQRRVNFSQNQTRKERLRQLLSQEKIIDQSTDPNQMH